MKDGAFPRERRSRAPLDVIRTDGSRMSAVKALRELLRRSGCAAVHTHTPRSAAFGCIVAGLERLPLVHHVHSPTRQCTERALRNFLAGGLERIAFARADRLIPVSEALVDYLLAEHAPPSRIRRVYNGVPRMQVLPRREPGPAWVLGVVGLFRPRKGLEVLLRALERLTAAGVQVSLRAVGPFETAEYRGQVLELARRLGVDRHIEWVGFSHDVPAELAPLAGLVLPGLYGEGLPMVILEAMAAGVPVVARRVAGVSEAIEHGVNGLLVPPHDDAALAATPEALLAGQHSWRELRAAALAEHAERFSAEAMAAGVASVYEELLETGLQARRAIGL